MARYTFTCEHFDYNDFNGDEQNVAAKHTTEFRADTLETMLENFEMFLRGAGFQFDGVIDVIYLKKMILKKTFRQLMSLLQIIRVKELWIIS
jgi:hypothetical protein